MSAAITVVLPDVRGVRCQPDPAGLGAAPVGGDHLGQQLIDRNQFRRQAQPGRIGHGEILQIVDDGLQLQGLS